MLKIIFLILMSGGIPVAIAMAGSALIYIWWTGGLPAFVVIHRMVSGIDSFPLLAVPFFILAGNLMNNAGITNRIYNYALALVGWMKGGLGHVNVVGSVIFAGMSGTAIADAAGLGTIEIKVGAAGQLDDFQLSGEGWRVTLLNPAGPVDVQGGTSYLVEFRGSPIDAEKPLMFTATFDGRRISKRINLGPKFFEDAVGD